MTLDEAIKHCEEVAIEQDKLYKRYDDASGYSRSHNEAIRTTDAKRCEECAKEHRQLAEWLRELKQLKEQKFYVTTRKLSDDELKHLVEQMEKDRWQIISVEQDPCDDAISRKAAIDAMIKIEQDDIDQYGCEIPEGFDSGPAIEALNGLQPVAPPPKTGHWIEKDTTYYEELNKRGLGVDEYTPYFTDDIACSECLAKYSTIDNETQFFKYCPNCGAKMESEE